MTEGTATGRHLGRADIFGVAWSLVAGIVALLPALVHGAGIYDDINAIDLVDSTSPWNILAWREVHSGHLPLWNPYSALGAPLSFNWHADPFSLQALVGYLMPLHLDLAAQLITTLVIAGSGIYFLCVTLRVGPLGCAFAATTFELSGAFMGWLGLPVAGTMAWSGWLFGAAIMLVRGRRPVRDVVLFAVLLGLTIYSSQPETLLQLGLALGLFLLVVLAARARRQGLGAAVRPVARLALATAAGLLLGAPLILPSLQVISISMTGHVPNVVRNALPLGNLFFLSNVTLKAYLGLIGVVLAVVAARFRYRRPEVLGLLLVTLTAAAAALLPFVVSALNHLTAREAVHWNRATLSLGLGLSVLGGIGLDVLLRDRRRQAVLKWSGATFALAGVGLLIAAVASGHLSEPEAMDRTWTFVWRAIEVVLGLAVTLVLWRQARRPAPGPGGRTGWRRWSVPAVAGVALLTCETAFLATAGASQWASSATSEIPWGPSQATSSVQQAVGATNLVAFGDNRDCFPGSLGILQDVNVEYRLDELAVYDPATPNEYLQAWKAATGRSAYVPWGMYCPAVTSAALARLYGVGDVLEPPGARPPAGLVPAGKAGYSELYRVPGSARATTSPLDPGGALPPAGAPGTPARLVQGYSTWKVQTDAPGPAVLRLRLTDVPGWHATIDGHPLPLERFAGIMLQARIPAGSHEIVLHYWPGAFTLGLALAGVTAVALVAVPVVLRTRRARRQPPPAAGGS